MFNRDLWRFPLLRQVAPWLRRLWTSDSSHRDPVTEPLDFADAFGHRVECVGEVACGKTHPGLVREANEDAFFIDPRGDLLIVADGMGGHAAGEVASSVAIDAVRAALSERQPGDDPPRLLKTAFAIANQAILDRADEHLDYAGMGTTLLVALVYQDEVWIAHAGDVRAYVLRAGQLSLLTFDHTAGGRQLRAGAIAEDALRVHPHRNQVMRYVGSPALYAPEYTRHPLAPGDLLLLCSDGLWDELDHDEIAAIMTSAGPIKDLVAELVRRALVAGGNDNVTAVIRCQAPVPPAE